MARLRVELPIDKKMLFEPKIVDLGIDHKSIRSRELNRRRKQHSSNLFTLHKIANRFILFDWEFFSNELEYE